MVPKQPPASTVIESLEMPSPKGTSLEITSLGIPSSDDPSRASIGGGVVSSLGVVSLPGLVSDPGVVSFDAESLDDPVSSPPGFATENSFDEPHADAATMTSKARNGEGAPMTRAYRAIARCQRFRCACECANGHARAKRPLPRAQSSRFRPRKRGCFRSDTIRC